MTDRQVLSERQLNECEVVPVSGASGWHVDTCTWLGSDWEAGVKTDPSEGSAVDTVTAPDSDTRLSVSDVTVSVVTSMDVS